MGGGKRPTRASSSRKNLSERSEIDPSKLLLERQTRSTLQFQLSEHAETDDDSVANRSGYLPALAIDSRLSIEHHHNLSFSDPLIVRFKMSTLSPVGSPYNEMEYSSSLSGGDTVQREDSSQKVGVQGNDEPTDHMGAKKQLSFSSLSSSNKNNKTTNEVKYASNRHAGNSEHGIKKARCCTLVRNRKGSSSGKKNNEHQSLNDTDINAKTSVQHSVKSDSGFSSVMTPAFSQSPSQGNSPIADTDNGTSLKQGPDCASQEKIVQGSTIGRNRMKQMNRAPHVKGEKAPKENGKTKSLSTISLVRTTTRKADINEQETISVMQRTGCLGGTSGSKKLSLNKMHNNGKTHLGGSDDDDIDGEPLGDDASLDSLPLNESRNEIDALDLDKGDFCNDKKANVNVMNSMSGRSLDTKHPYIGKRVHISQGKFAGFSGEVISIGSCGWWTIDHPDLIDRKVHSRMCEMVDRVEESTLHEYYARVGMKMSRFPSVQTRQPQREQKLRGGSDHDVKGGNGNGDSERAVSFRTRTQLEVRRRKRGITEVETYFPPCNLMPKTPRKLQHSTESRSYRKARSTSSLYNDDERSCLNLAFGETQEPGREEAKFCELPSNSFSDNKADDNETISTSAERNSSWRHQYNIKLRRPISTAMNSRIGGKSAFKQRTPHHIPALPPARLHDEDGSLTLPCVHHLPPDSKVDIFNRKTGLVMCGEEAVCVKDLPDLLRKHAEYEPIIPPHKMPRKDTEGNSVLSVREGRSASNVRVSETVIPQQRVRASAAVGKDIVVTAGPYRGFSGKVQACIPGGWYLVSGLLDDDGLELDLVISSNQLEVISVTNSIVPNQRKVPCATPSNAPHMEEDPTAAFQRLYSRFFSNPIRKIKVRIDDLVKEKAHLVAQLDAKEEEDPVDIEDIKVERAALLQQPSNVSNKSESSSFSGYSFTRDVVQGLVDELTKKVEQRASLFMTSAGKEKPLSAKTDLNKLQEQLKHVEDSICKAQNELDIHLKSAAAVKSQALQYMSNFGSL